MVITLPAEYGKEKEVLELIRQWGADAIRDSDGTRLSDDIIKTKQNMGYKIYSTICLVRSDQTWAKEHKGHLVEKYLMSAPVTATGSTVEIDLMAGYFKEKYEIDTRHDPQKMWEVIDRTTGEVVDAGDWQFNTAKGRVVINKANKFHSYTVNFLVYQIWDSTSMYNHITNNWTTDHIMSVDPYFTQTYNHLMEYFDDWLKKHPDTDVVRFTTLAYHFTLDSDQNADDKYRDWLGYTDCISPAILEDFAKAKGYYLRSEDIVDQGYYNAVYRVPSQRYLDWMDFIQKFVVKFGKDLVDRVHKAGKKAAYFCGDHWVGLEPYGPYYQEMGVDILIGACEDGVALRRVADVPDTQTKEIRLYPYFFPDVFSPGGNPLQESISNWVKIRRALLRKPVDRIGYGGYPSLILQFPEFIAHVTDLCNEFREIVTRSGKTPAYTAPVKTLIVSAWGKLRSWIYTIGPSEKFNTGRAGVFQISGSNLLECLCGLPVEVAFMSFDEIEQNGIPDDIDVIINDGSAGTAWSGGKHWINPAVISQIREWIYKGGGFIGVRDPSACEYQGRFFQLADVMGVQKETGNTIQASVIRKHCLEKHFISEDLNEKFNCGIEDSFVYVCDEKVDVLASSKSGHVLMSAAGFGKGRAVYLAALPFSLQNARLLYRALLWSAQQEAALKKWFSSNPNTECAAFPKRDCFIVVNNVNSPENTIIYDHKGNIRQLALKPYESKCLTIGE